MGSAPVTLIRSDRESRKRVCVCAHAQTRVPFNREQLCFTRLHVIQDDTKSKVALDLHLPLMRDMYMPGGCVFLAKLALRGMTISALMERHVAEISGS